MKRNLLLCLALLSFIGGKAQQVFDVNNCVTITSYLAGKGDTVVIKCDSVYLLNKKTYSIYQIAYEKVKGRDANVKQIFSTYESLLDLQSKRIEEQDLEYNRLKMQFDSLVATSGKFIDKTGNRLGELTDAMNKVNANLNSALGQIKESETVMKSQGKKDIRNSIVWGVGGFTLGLITCLLLN